MVTTQDFTNSAARYAGYWVKAANGNNDRYLTKAEAAKLPADLRDNYAEIQRGDSNRQVTVAEFKTAWTAKVARSLSSADRNEDGMLERGENRYFPNNLRDNLANYMNKVDARGIASKEAFQSAIAGALSRHDWDAFKALCNPANVEAQTSIGIGSEQYVREAIGLGFVSSPFADMSAKALVDSIKSVTFDRTSNPADGTLTGTLKLKDGRTAPISIPVAKVGNGLLITPAWG